jgi:hypothetical protein
MRLINKYKKYQKNFLLLNSFPKARLLKFNRPKWLKLKNLLKKKKKRIKFFNNLLFKAPYKRWEKIKLAYKEGLNRKKMLSAFFDNSLSSKSIKMYTSSTSSKSFLPLLIKSFILPLFKLDILLWKLAFYNSTYESKQSIKNKNIFVNFENKKENFTLVKGDIIQIKNLNKNLNRVPLLLLNSFLEVDYYTNTIIVLKSPEDFSDKDLFFILTEYIQYKKLLDFVTKN